MLKPDSLGRSNPHAILMYGLAVLSVLAAVIVLRLMETHERAAAHVSVLLFAIIFSVWFGGIRTGVLAIALSILAFDYFFLPPVNSLAMESAQVPRLLAFVALAVVVGTLVLTQKTAAESLKRASNVLQRSNQALQAENSERESAEAALTESRRRLEEAQRIAHVGHWERDLDTGLITWSDEIYRIVGLAPPENGSSPTEWQHLVHPEDRERVAGAIEAAQRGVRRYDVEYRIVRPDGEVRFLHSQGDLIRDQHGRPRRAFGIAQDITERKRTEDALRETKAKLELILNTSPLPITSADAEGRLTTWNKAAERLFGWTEQEVVGRVCPTVPPWDVKNYLELIRTVMHGEPCVGLVRYRQNKSGSLLSCNVSCAPQRDGRGQLIGVTLIVEDITDRKRAEEALRENQQLLQLVLATLPVGVAVTDRAGDIVLVNAASKCIWGDVVVSGRQRWARTKGYWHGSRQQIAPTAWASVRALSDGQTSLNELIDIETYNGQQKTIQNSAAPIHSAEGLIVGAVIVNDDVTERVRAEEQLKRSNEELRALSARLHSVREEESARIAREIHDELGAVLSSLKWDLEEIHEVISESTDRSRPDQVRPKVEAMIRLTDNALYTVRRISSELRPTALEELGLVEALRWHAREFQARTGIVVDCDFPAEEIKLDREHSTAIFRIFQEAMTNVLRHAQATTVDIRMKQGDGEVVLAIRDNGRGLTEEEASGPQSLGLLGMRERAHLIDGEIDIVSSAGQGTTITLRVPSRGSRNGRNPDDGKGTTLSNA